MPTLTVDEIVRRIETHLTTNDFDPANDIGTGFIVWSGEPNDDPGSRNHADHITIHRIEWDDGKGKAHLLPEDRDRLVRQLRSTAAFDGWSQADDAREVLIASGIIEPVEINND
jgi:hypothetical protein